MLLPREPGAVGTSHWPQHVSLKLLCWELLNQRPMYGLISVVHHKGQLTGELLGRLAGAPLLKHTPSLTKGFLRSFPGSPGNPSAPALEGPQLWSQQITSPLHLQGSQHFLHLTASPLSPSGSCHCGYRQLPSLWEPGLVITCGPLGLPLGVAVSQEVCRTS